jgi:hypothetical protein
MNDLVEKADFNEVGNERERAPEPTTAYVDGTEPVQENEILPEAEISGDEEAVDIGTPIGNGFGGTRDIKITPLSSGFLVKVGCQSIAIETNEKLVNVMAKYLDNPNDFEKRWFSKDVRNRLENIL